MSCTSSEAGRSLNIATSRAQGSTEAKSRRLTSTPIHQSTSFKRHHHINLSSILPNSIKGDRSNRGAYYQMILKKKVLLPRSNSRDPVPKTNQVDPQSPMRKNVESANIETVFPAHEELKHLNIYVTFCIQPLPSCATFLNRGLTDDHELNVSHTTRWTGVGATFLVRRSCRESRTRPPNAGWDSLRSGFARSYEAVQEIASCP
jgi:hypothetical protein